MSIEIIAGLGLFVLGVILGAVFQRSFSGDSGKSKRLEQKLSETQDAYTKYQAEVSAHFMDTARKVQNLNNSYREVHEQLAKGASKLCSDDEANDFMAISLDNRSKGRTFSDDNEDDLPPMPMDYAPKEQPDEEGMLSERFGLKVNPGTAETGPAPSTPETPSASTSEASPTPDLTEADSADHQKDKPDTEKPAA